MRKTQNQISNNTGKIASALAQAQMEFGIFTTNREGYNYKYLDLAGILEKVYPILGKHKLAIIQGASLIVKDEMPYVVVTTKLMCEDEWIEDVLEFPMIEPVKKTDTDIMMLGSTISYLRRYAIQSMLGIAGTDREAEDMQKDMHKDVDTKRPNPNAVKGLK